MKYSLIFAILVLCAVWAPEQTMASSLSFVKKTIKDHPIVMFSKTFCPYCKRAKQTFAKLDVDPFVVELDERGDGSAIQDALAQVTGRRTVPQVFIEEDFLGGSDDTVAAYESGKLAQLVEKASKQEL
eukprot:jgi/Mesen1/5452/ME000273S04701